MAWSRAGPAGAARTWRAVTEPRSRGRGECRPSPLALSERHVHLLHLSSREPSFNVQVQSNECEGQPDRLRSLIRVLRSPRVHDMLMNELATAVTERVALQLLMSLALGNVSTLWTCFVFPFHLKPMTTADHDERF